MLNYQRVNQEESYLQIDQSVNIRTSSCQLPQHPWKQKITLVTPCLTPSWSQGPYCKMQLSNFKPWATKRVPSPSVSACHAASLVGSATPFPAPAGQDPPDFRGQSARSGSCRTEAREWWHCHPHERRCRGTSMVLGQLSHHSGIPGPKLAPPGMPRPAESTAMASCRCCWVSHQLPTGARGTVGSWR